MNKFRLAKDDSGHWYVIPVNKTEAFEKWVKKGGEGKTPKWLVQVGGSYSLVEFSDYSIK